MNFPDERRKEIEETLSKTRFSTSKFCAINGFSYNRETKTISTEMLKYHEHVKDLDPKKKH